MRDLTGQKYAGDVVAEATLAGATKRDPLPTDSAERKRTPLCTGCLDYFDAAFQDIVRVCQAEWNAGVLKGDEEAADVFDCLLRRGEPDCTAILALLSLCELSDELCPGEPRDWGEVRTVSDLFDCFAPALAEVSRVSWYGNEKHNPGQALHHARGKSTDHADTIARHYVERGGFDGPMRHTACLAWRCLAMLQQELEDAGAPLARGAKLPPTLPEVDWQESYVAASAELEQALAELHVYKCTSYTKAAWDRQAAWSDATFGTPAERGPAGALAHLKREADEAAADPGDVEEFADCQILIWDAARRAGHSLADLVAAVEAKQAKNEKREWNPPDADGVYTHKRSEGE